MQQIGHKDLSNKAYFNEIYVGSVTVLKLVVSRY